MKPTAILFDAVGTLIYPDPDVVTVYQRLGSDFGSSKTIEEVRLRFSDAYRAIFQSPRVNGSATNESIERAHWKQVVDYVFEDVADSATGLFDELWRHFAQPESWSLFDDVSETWQRLATRNIRLGIASNFDERLRRICDQLPVLSECEHIFISTEIGFSKPSTRFYERIADSLGAEPSGLLMVGDSQRNDVEAAKKCGWETCLLQRSPATTGGIKAIQSLRELL